MNSKKTNQKPMKKLMLKRNAYNAKSNSPNINNTQYNRNECLNSSKKNSPINRYSNKGRDSLNSTTNNNNLNSSKKQSINYYEKGKRDNDDLYYIEIQKDNNYQHLKYTIENNTIIDIKEGKKYIFDEIFYENQENDVIQGLMKYNNLIIDINLNVWKSKKSNLVYDDGLIQKIILNFLSNEEMINCKFLAINNDKILDLLKDNYEILINDKIDIQNIPFVELNNHKNLNSIINTNIQILKNTFFIFQILKTISSKEDNYMTFIFHENQHINDKIIKFINNNQLTIVHFFSISNFFEIIPYLDKNIIKRLKLQEKNSSLNLITTKGKLNQTSLSPPYSRGYNENNTPKNSINSKETLLNALMEENKKLIDENKKLKEIIHQIKEEISLLKEFLSIKPNELLIQENNKLIEINKKLNDSAHSYIQRIDNIAYELNNIDTKVYTFDDENSSNLSKSSIINSEKEYFKHFKKNFDNYFKEIANLPQNTLSGYTRSYKYYNSLKSTFNSFNCFMDTIMNNNFYKLFELSPNKLMKKTLELLFVNLYYEKMLFELFNHCIYENRKLIFNDFIIDKLIELYSFDNYKFSNKIDEIKKQVNSFDEYVELFIDNLSKENNIKLNEFITIFESLISDSGLLKIVNEKNINNQMGENNQKCFDKDSKIISNCSSINKDSFFGYIKNEECPEMIFDDDDSNINNDK